MQLMLKVLIVVSILSVHVGLGCEELIASFYPEYSRYNRVSVAQAYDSAKLSDAQALIQVQRLDIDSRDFYSRVSYVSKRLVYWSSFFFYSSLGLLLKRDIEKLVAKLRSAKKRPRRSKEPLA